MTKIKLPRRQIILAFAFALALVISSSYLTQIQARPVKPVISAVRFVPPPVPTLADRSAPSGRSRGGASRGQCPDVSKPLTALVPTITEKTLNLQQALADSGLNTYEVVWARTTDPSPSLWFYVPYSLTPKLPIRFVLQDEADNYVYPETPFIVSQASPGIIKFPFPSTTPLQIGKMYHWWFGIDCTADNPIYIDGWIQRVSIQPELKSQLAQATPRQQAALYAANGIWYDAIAKLAERRTAQPDDIALKNDWVSLLNSVHLDAIANEPIIPCCTPKIGEQQLGER